MNGNRDSWAMMLDNSTSTTFENSALSGPEQKWGLREWLISASFVVALVIILLKPTLNDEDAEDSNQESIGNEIAPVKKKRIDEEARKANILNLFLSKHNQQVRNDTTGEILVWNLFFFSDTSQTWNFSMALSGNHFGTNQTQEQQDYRKFINNRCI